MAQDIVSGIFGMTPFEVQQQQQQAINQQAANYARMPLMQRGDMGLYQGAAGLANLGAGMLGLRNPQMEQAQQMQQAAQGVDTTSAKGLAELAAKLQSMSMYPQALAVAAQAREAAAKEAAQRLAAQKQEFEETDKLQLKQDKLAAEAAKNLRDDEFRRWQVQMQREGRMDAIRMAAMLKNGQAAAKPLPPTALKMQQEATDAVSTASNIANDIGAVIGQIERGELNLGPIKNLLSSAKNTLGLSTPESRNLMSFRATLEKLRNDSLRLNKGAQTDKDAQNAWNELVKEINDPEAVKQRLIEIQEINNRAVAQKTKEVDLIRMNYGYDPLDMSPFTKQPSALGSRVGKSSKGTSGTWEVVR